MSAASPSSPRRRSVEWHGHRINIVDTPGHADFGGEVERILGMVDGVLLLVDAAEGPMPQTKFVTAKALRLGLRPIVVLNKVDRPDAEPDRALNEVFDLFVTLDADEHQLDFPVLYASGRAGWADPELDGPRKNLDALYELDPLPRPGAGADRPPRRALLHAGDDARRRPLPRPPAHRAHRERARSAPARPSAPSPATAPRSSASASPACSPSAASIRTPIEEAEAGDIVSLSGMAKATVADTIADLSVTGALPSQPIDPPTISVTFGINDSPLAGRDGDKVQSRVIRERLMREAETNVAIKVSDTPAGEAFEVAGRGELQMGVLVENMRREGFELSVSRPRVLFREEDGQRLEPIEEVTIDVDEEFSGVVVDKLSQRKGELAEMRTGTGGKTRIVAHVPSRGLIGYHGEFLTDTRGTGVLNRVFHGWAPHKGAIPGRRNGVLVSMEDGVSVPYAIFNLEDRGRFFIGSGEQVYTGMILGEHNRDNDLEVNPLKGKKLTNVRASGKDEAVVLTTPGPPDAGAGHRLRRGRRAGRGHSAPHPAAQAPPRPARAQAARAAERAS